MSSPESSSESPDRKRRRRSSQASSDTVLATSNKWLKRGGIALAIALAIGLLARPTYQKTKEFRAHLLVSKVDKLLAAGKANECGKPLQTALQLAPRAPEVLRAAARVCTASKMAEAPAFWRMLAEVTPLSPEDRRAFAEAAMDQGQLSVAQEQLLTLSKLDPKDLATRHLALQLMQLQNRTADAIPVARSTLSLAPDDPRSRLILASLLAQTTNSSLQSESRRIYWDLAFSTNALREPAIDALILDSALTRGQNIRLVQELAKRTNNTLGDGLRLAELHWKLDPSNLVSIATSLAAPVQRQTNLVDTLRVAAWLAGKDLPEHVLSFCESSVIRTNPALLPSRIEALAQLKRWPEVEDLLVRHEKDLGPIFFKCYQALLTATRGDRARAESILRAALATAGTRREPLRLVSRAAENARLPDVAIAAERLLLGLPGQALVSSRNLFRLLGPRPEVRMARDLFVEMINALPGDPAVIIEACYLQGVLAENLPQCRQLLEELGPKIGSFPEAQISLALVQAQSGNTTAALSALESTEIHWDTAPSRWRAVYALVLGKADQREAARRMAASVDRRELRDQELAMISPWL